MPHVASGAPILVTFGGTLLQLDHLRRGDVNPWSAQRLATGTHTQRHTAGKGGNGATIHYIQRIARGEEGGGGGEERRNFRPKLTDETTTMMERQEDRPVYGCGHSIVYHSRRLAFGQGNWSLAHRADKVPMNKRRNKLLTTPRVIGIALFVPMCRKHLHGDVLVLRH